MSACRFVRYKVVSEGDGTWNVDIETEYLPGITAIGTVRHFASRETARIWARKMKRADRSR